MKLSRVGIDLAKNVYQLHGVDHFGKTVWKRRLKRHQWLAALLDKTEPGCEIGMEACASAHHWGRELQSRDYTVKLIPPQFVKPYVKSNKNDARDAEAICEAMGRPNMRFVTAIGITPKQHSSGDRDRLLGISKHGDVYLRTLMIHGARSVVASAKHKDDPLSRWVTGIATKRHPNVAAVALANKTARMAWAMLRNKTDYDPDFAIR